MEELDTVLEFHGVLETDSLSSMMEHSPQASEGTVFEFRVEVRHAISDHPGAVVFFIFL